MDENLRFIALVEALKEQGQVADYVQLAATLGTNKAGISDIKAGRKKISIELLRRMKLSYPATNVEWVIMGVGEMFAVREQPQNTQDEPLIERIIEQAKEIGRLEQRIKELEQRLEKTAGDVSTGNTANVG
ncbi:transcriptional regulator [Duncaniella muris]|uniref:transcriptional regulator n=1 Tax=Duncaniella muris TaxID=2094150 RepID=UPI00259CA233|nr:transcriptional regulator [Duncaniella muris]